MCSFVAIYVFMTIFLILKIATIWHRSVFFIFYYGDGDLNSVFLPIFLQCIFARREQ